jgi:acetylornithine aminotransferase
MLHVSRRRDLEAAAAVIKKGQTAAVFVEPIQGEGGIHPGEPAAVGSALLA